MEVLNSPGQGAMFSLLTLKQPIKTPSVITIASTSRSKKSKAGAIAGAIVASLVGVGGIALGIFFFLRRRRARKEKFVQSETPSMAPISPLGLSEGVAYEPFRFSGELTGSGNLVEDPHAFSNSQPSIYSDGRFSQGTEGRHGRHRAGPSLTSTELGPSASQVGVNSTVTNSSGGSSGMAATSHRTRQSNYTNTSVSSKQGLVNEELRSEVENLRREMERIRQERTVNLEEAPPSYTDFS